MSTQPKTTPMNISPQNIAGTCNYKCAFSFDYPVSSCTATNAGNNITLSYTDSTSPVTFNKTKYNITSCYIYSPSLHSYNNVQADAELFIMHTPTSGGQGLMVCIPISTNGTSNAASNTIGEIISAMSKGAPSQGGSTNQGITDFTLNDFIPMKEFYNYSGNGSDFVAFGMQNAIYISQSNLDAMNKIITPLGAVVFPSGPSLFVNPDGPTKGAGVNGSDIYIDCQPTNASDEETNEVVSIKANTDFDAGITISSIIFNPIFLILLFAFVFVIILMLIHKGLVVLTGGSADGDVTGSSSSSSS